MTGKQSTKDHRIGIIKTVQTPLGFFVLVVLVVEVILGALASAGDNTTEIVTVVGMVFVILVLIAIVAYFAYNRPEALIGERPPIEASQSDSAILALMQYHSKEALTVIRVTSESGKLVAATITGANDKDLYYYGFRPNQADRIIGQASSFLMERLSLWISTDHLRAFKKDQEHVFSDLDRGYEAYAKVPMIIDDRHPFNDLHGRRFLPVTIAHSKSQTIRKKRIEDILVGYFDLDEIAKGMRQELPEIEADA